MPILGTRSGVSRKLLDHFNAAMMPPSMEDVLDLFPGSFKHVPTAPSDQYHTVNFLIECRIPQVEFITKSRGGLGTLPKLERLVLDVIFNSKL